MRHKNLASERVRVGLSQEALADALDSSIASIHEYESFKRDMPTEFLIKAADYFGCSIEYLLDRTDERLPMASD